MGTHVLPKESMTDAQRREAEITGLIVSAFDELTVLGNKIYAGTLIDRAIDRGASPALIDAFNVAVAVNHARRGNYGQAYDQLRGDGSCGYAALLNGLCRECGLQIEYAPSENFCSTDATYWETIGKAARMILDADPTAADPVSILFIVASLLQPRRPLRSERPKVHVLA